MKFPRFLKIVLLSLVSLILLLATTTIAIVYFYEDEVKQVLVSQINKQLITPVSVKNIELSLFKKFPNATLVFTDVSAKSVQPNDSLMDPERFNENLFDAHKIFIQFNILDIYHKNYTIKKIDIESANLHLLINQKGNDNFHFWKKSKDSTVTNFKLSLEEINVNDVTVSYKNDFIKHLYSFVIKESELNGSFSESSYTLNTKGIYFVEDISINKTTFLKQKTVLLDGILLVSNNEKFEIQDVTLQVNDLLFDLNGYYATSKFNNDEIDIGIKGKNLDLKTLISLLPETYRKNLNTYSSSGLFYFDAQISGIIGEGAEPKIAAKFGIQKGEIHEENSHLDLKKINLTGSYTNGKSKNSTTSELSIRDFHAQLGAGKVLGSFRLKNFDNPYLTIIAEAQLNISQVKQFLKLDTLEKCSGFLTLDIDFSGNTKHISHFSEADFAKTKTQGNLTLEQGNIKFVGAKHAFENLNASLMFNNNDIVVNEFNGKIEDSDFALKGFFRNALAASFNKNEVLYIDATLTSRVVNLNQILSDNEASSDNNKTFQLAFSDRINFNLNAEIRSLVFKKFDATNIKGTMKLQNKKLALSPITFNTLDGTVLANGIVDGSENSDFKTHCEADLRNITISKLFYVFENFGGSTLTDKNLKGKASATVRFSGDFTPELNSKTESIVSQFDLTIENGELINFEPMRKLSRFISLSELNDIRFTSLKNSIIIKNRKIYVPTMEINSSAINLTVAGTHTFDNTVDYHFKLLLDELLGKKARKAKPENNEFGTIEDDGLGIGKTAIYISMNGPLENPKITYDRSGLKMQIKQNVTNETKNLMSILKNEFGWFKNDTSIKSPRLPKQNTRFETEWDESDKKSISNKNQERALPKVESDSASFITKKKVKALDNLLKKTDDKKSKKKVTNDEPENSDDFN